MPNLSLIVTALLSLSHSFTAAAKLSSHNVDTSNLGGLSRRTPQALGPPPGSTNSTGPGNGTNLDSSRIKIPLNSRIGGSKKGRIGGVLGDTSLPVLDLEASITNMTSAENQTIYATPYNRTALLTFLSDAYNWAADQLNKDAPGAEDNHYFKFSDSRLNMILAIRDTSITPRIGWGTFGNAAAALYDYTTNNLPDQNATWVGVLYDGDPPKPKVDLIITTAFVDAARDSNVTSFPTPTYTETGDNGGRRLRHRRNPLVPDPDDDDDNDDDSSSSNNNISGSSPGPHELSKRRNNLAVQGTDYTFSVLRSFTKTVLTGTLYELTKSAYNKFIADTTNLDNYVQFTVPLTSELLFGAGGAGLTLSSAFTGVVFQFQAAGTAVISRAVMLQFLRTLAGYTEKYGLQNGRHAVLHGNLFNAAGQAVASYSIGSAIDKAVVPLVSVAGCIVEHPDGSSVVACLVRDEL